MPHQPVAAVAAFFRFGGVAEHVRAALLFRHPHANQQAALLRAGGKVRIIAIAEQRRQPVVKCFGERLLQQRRGGERHGDRAKRARLHLSMKHKACGPSDKRPFTRLLFPRQVMHAVGAKPLHQQVPCRMKTHVVQPLSGGVIA